MSRLLCSVDIRWRLGSTRKHAKHQLLPRLGDTSVTPRHEGQGPATPPKKQALWYGDAQCQTLGQHGSPPIVMILLHVVCSNLECAHSNKSPTREGRDAASRVLHFLDTSTESSTAAASPQFATTWIFSQVAPHCLDWRSFTCVPERVASIRPADVAGLPLPHQRWSRQWTRPHLPLLWWCTFWSPLFPVPCTLRYFPKGALCGGGLFLTTSGTALTGGPSTFIIAFVARSHTTVPLGLRFSERARGHVSTVTAHSRRAAARLTLANLLL